MKLHQSHVQKSILFPASLLKQKSYWNQLVQAMPADHLWLVTRLDNPKATKSLLNLAVRLEKQGRRVDVLTLGS